MECINYQPWISGAAQPELTQDRPMGIAIAMAPPGEQAQTVNAQDEETAPLRAAIQRARREIDLLREYHTRLIADVVTGKLHVREAAASLPKEVEEPEPLDEPATEADGDEALADVAEAAPQEVEA